MAIALGDPLRRSPLHETRVALENFAPPRLSRHCFLYVDVGASKKYHQVVKSAFRAFLE